MNKFTIDFEIVTPTFMAGANQKAAEFRLPSFKGLLRFWWRAIAFPNLQSIQKMKKEEGEIFGSTDNASKIILNMESYRDVKKPVQFKNKGGLTYLGYGVVDYRGNPTRRFIFPASTGRISILCHGIKDNKQLERLKNALVAFALFGNMGSKSRKGYGSINFRNITLDGTKIYVQPKSVEELVKKLQSFCAVNRFANFKTQPPLSAFSANARIDVLDTGTDALSLLNSIGEQMALYRSWGRNGRVMGKTAERNFRNDHDLIKNMQIQKKPHKHPKRVIFGLPHNYFFGSSKFKVNVEPDSREINRRTSPLFLKIHKLRERNFVAVSLILKSQFLPQRTRIKISSKRITVSVPVQPDWTTLINFLDGNTKQNKPRFPNKQTIFP